MNCKSFADLTIPLSGSRKKLRLGIESLEEAFSTQHSTLRQAPKP